MLSFLSPNLPFIYSYYYFFMFPLLFETYIWNTFHATCFLSFFNSLFFTIFHFFRLVLLLHFLLFFLYFLNIYHFRIVFLFIFDFPIPSLHRFRLVFTKCGVLSFFICWYFLKIARLRRLKIVYFILSIKFIYLKRSPFIFGFSYLWNQCWGSLDLVLLPSIYLSILHEEYPRSKTMILKHFHCNPPL